jgi:hypothetical protein
MRKKIYHLKKVIVMLLLITCFSCVADELKDCRYSKDDVLIFNKVMDKILPIKNLPMSELMIETSHVLLGTPYVAGTLEIEPEMLTINMRETDCILFVEMCLALSLTAKDDKPNFENYCNNIRNLRYFKGKVKGYSSRLHYTSSWISQAEKSKILKEISAEIGGTKLKQTFSFMSSHFELYKQLKENPLLVSEIKKTEARLNKDEYYYIPKANIVSIKNKINSGDIICFNSSVEGLDIAHVGLALWKNGELTFIHASYTEKKVVINKIPLVEYTNGIKSHNGLRILRVL